MPSTPVKIGLDLGSHGLKWVALDSQQQPVRVFAAEVFPDRETQNDQPHPRWLAARLAEMLEECRSSVSPVWCEQVRAGLQGEGVVCGYLELPGVDPDELGRALPTALQNILPFSIQDVGLSWIAVPPYREGSGPAVFYGTYLKTMAQQIRRLLESSGLELEAMEVTSLALTREFRRNHNPPPELFQALVHIGFSSSHVLVMRGGFPYYARDFELAGKAFTYSFQIGYQTTWSKAERYKLDYRVATKDFQIEPFLLDWTDEVKRSLGHFTTRFPGAKVGRIFLSGGTALWDGLDKRLQEALGIPVTLDGWNQLQVPGGEAPMPEAALYKVAMGLALT